MDYWVICVRPAPGGWAVTAPDMLVGPLMFLSGGRAERQAWSLADAAAVNGRAVELSIYDRQEQLVAAAAVRPRRFRLVHDAPPPPDPDPGTAARACPAG